MTQEISFPGSRERGGFIGKVVVYRIDAGGGSRQGEERGGKARGWEVRTMIVRWCDGVMV